MKDILKLTKEGLDSLLNLIYPPLCGICNKRLLEDLEINTSTCKDCLQDIKHNVGPYCVKCGRSLNGSTENVTVCWDCFDKQTHYERNYSAVLYEGVAREALHLLKYSGRTSLVNLFCVLLIDFLEKNPEILKEIDGALAVPLHSIRQREREFNQVDYLVSAILKKFKLTEIRNCLVRIRPTHPQSDLDKPERTQNVRDAFQIRQPNLILGKSLLLVDDLFTTGATINECARVLRKNGAKKVRCLTFARGA